MIILANVLGYFSDKIPEGKIKEMIRSANELDYTISEKIYFDKCCLYTLKSNANITKSDKVTIVSYGKVFNSEIIDMNDSILSLYKKNRLDELKRFNGAFVAVIYDQDNEKITILNDRYGQMSFFYFNKEKNFAFAPKIKILSSLEGTKEIRMDAIVDFFLFGYLLGEKTFFKNIYKLSPASIIEKTKDKLKIKRYWDFDYKQDEIFAKEEYLIEKLGNLWEKAIEKRIIKNKKIIIPISGGLDSRAILACIIKKIPKDSILTFTFGQKGSYDFEIGKKIAKKAGIDNVSLDMEYNDFEKQYTESFSDSEGLIDASPYLPISKYKSLKKYGSDIYLGYMGDPLMGGHISFEAIDKKIEKKDDFKDIKRSIFKKNKIVKMEIYKKMFKNEFLKNYLDLSTFEKTFSKHKDCEKQKFANLFSKWDFRYRQVNYIIPAIFRHIQYFNYYSPFLDNELVDFILKIPPELRFNEKLYKKMLIKKYPEFFKMPTKNNLGLGLNASTFFLFLKKVIYFSKKKINKVSVRAIKRNIFLDKFKNYHDYGELLRTNDSYRQFVWEKISLIKKRDFFNNDYIDRLWDLHMGGKHDFSQIFGLIVTFEMILEKYFNHEEKCSD